MQGNRDVKLQPSIEKNEVKSECLFMLEDGVSCFHKGKKDLTKMEMKYLHTVRAYQSLARTGRSV